MSTPSPKLKWSHVYWGIQHLGNYSNKNHWVTVIDYKKFAILNCHFPGCSFGQAVEVRYDTVLLARRAGERYLRKHGYNC